MIDAVIVIISSHHSKAQRVSCNVLIYDVCWLQSVNPDISIESDDSILRKTVTPVLLYSLCHETEAYVEIYVDLWQKLGWKKLYKEELR